MCNPQAHRRRTKSIRRTSRAVRGRRPVTLFAPLLSVAASYHALCNPVHHSPMQLHGYNLAHCGGLGQDQGSRTEVNIFPSSLSNAGLFFGSFLKYAFVWGNLAWLQLQGHALHKFYTICTTRTQSYASEVMHYAIVQSPLFSQYTSGCRVLDYCKIVNAMFYLGRQVTVLIDRFIRHVHGCPSGSHMYCRTLERQHD